MPGTTRSGRRLRADDRADEPPVKLRRTACTIATKLGTLLQQLEELTAPASTATHKPPVKQKKKASKPGPHSGTGFGGSSSDVALIPSKASARAQEQKHDAELGKVFQALADLLHRSASEAAGRAWQERLPLLPLRHAASPLLRNGSLADMGARKVVYGPLLGLVEALAKRTPLAVILTETDPGGSHSLLALLQALDRQCELLPAQRGMGAVATMMNMAEAIRRAYREVRQALKDRPEDRPPSVAPLHAQYQLAFQSSAVDQCDILGTSKYSFREAVEREAPAGAAAKRRLMELPRLHGNLPRAWEGAIAVRVDEGHSHVLKALITGPAGTPYANGVFIFDVLLPAHYPTGPPKVHLVTTRTNVRFNPNLYENGYVCLSLLGTWSGPGWRSNSSNLYEVLVNLQSIVMVPEPYFNEPGYEAEQGTAHGKANSEFYNRNIRMYTSQLAILNALRCPEPCFASLIRTHFLLKREEIKQQLREWRPKMNSFDQLTPTQLLEQVDAELDKLEGQVAAEVDKLVDEL